MNAPVLREPRAATITAAVTTALRAHKPLTESAYADAVVTLYHERTALHERAVEFRVGATAEAYEAAARLNAQTVKRMLKGDVRLPVDLEEAMVLALPEPERRRCLAELADRYGLLAIPKPCADIDGQALMLSDFCREFGEAMQRIAPMLADLVIDERDRAEAPAAIKELQDVVTTATALIELIRTTTATPRVASFPRKKRA
jgi:hypothetical protein